MDSLPTIPSSGELRPALALAEIPLVEIPLAEIPCGNQPHPYRQTLRNASEFTALFRTFDELKKRLDNIHAGLNNLRDM